MDNNTLSIYHNGFIGKASLFKKDDTVSEIVQNEAGVMHVIQYVDKSSTALDSNSQLEKLFYELTKSNHYVKNFDRRHRFLEEALGTLPTTGHYNHVCFKTFALLQKESPFFSDLHRRFIEDTYRYVLEGKRRVSIYAWRGLFMNYVKERSLKTIDYSDEFKALLNRYGQLNFPRFIQQWVSNESGTGMDDLANTFLILYGKIDAKSRI